MFLFVEYTHLPSICKGDTNRFIADTQLLILGADDFQKQAASATVFSPFPPSVIIYNSHLFMMFKSA